MQTAETLTPAPVPATLPATEWAAIATEWGQPSGGRMAAMWGLMRSRHGLMRSTFIAAPTN